MKPIVETVWTRMDSETKEHYAWTQVDNAVKESDFKALLKWTMVLHRINKSKVIKY